MIGKPMEFAANEITMPGQAAMVSDTPTTTLREGRVPDNAAIYLAGGYIDGAGAAMPNTAPGGRDRFDGFYVATGIEARVSDAAMLGFGLSYTKIDGKIRLGQSARGELIQGTSMAAWADRWARRLTCRPVRASFSRRRGAPAISGHRL